MHGFAFVSVTASLLLASNDCANCFVVMQLNLYNRCS